MRKYIEPVAQIAAVACTALPSFVWAGPAWLVGRVFPFGLAEWLIRTIWVTFTLLGVASLASLIAVGCALARDPRLTHVPGHPVYFGRELAGLLWLLLALFAPLLVFGLATGIGRH